MFYNSTTYLRGFFKFPLHVLQFYNLPERIFTFPLHILYSQVYQRFLQVFLSTILHPSIYQEIYISSPRFYIPPRNIGFLSTFLHSTTYIQQSRKSSQENEK